MIRKSWLPAILLTAVATSLATNAGAEDVYLKRPVGLLSDSSAAADRVANAQKGDKATVIERNANWVKVNLNGKEGWVGADSLSQRPVKADTALLGGNSMARASDAEAGKGLEPMSIDYSKSHNLSPAGINEMVAVRKAITSAMLKDFVTTGQIESPKKTPPKP